MSEQRRIVKRYSAAFKQQLVGQIERGEISVAKAMQRYDIRGTTTIDRWLKQHGKHHLLATVVRIEMAEERDRIKALEEKVRTLERAFARRYPDLSVSTGFSKTNFSLTKPFQALNTHKKVLPKRYTFTTMSVRTYR